MNKYVVGYLSAAPRVSTRIETELIGPRTHVLGVINAFEGLGWEVKQFIVGDRVPLSWNSRGSETSLKQSKLRILFADIARLGMGTVNALRAYRELGQEVDWVYERLAIFQLLGSIFKRNGKLWILETNAPLYIEAKNDRQSIVLGSLARFLENQAYRGCDILVCISDTLADIVVKQAGISPNKIVIVPNGVDVSFFSPNLYQANRLFDGFTIGFVGKFASWQGLDLLIDAVSNLRAEGFDLNSVLVGDGPERTKLVKKVQELGLAPFVKFVGVVPQSEVPNYIAGFDVGYSGQTQRTEDRMYCSPIKVYEYMAMSVPAIASDYEDTRRVMKNGTGFLFEIENLEDLQQVIVQAYQSKEDLPEMGVRAREEIIRDHSWIARISHMIAFIQEKQGKSSPSTNQS